MRLLAVARDANHYHITRDGRPVASLSLRTGGSGLVELASGGALPLHREGPSGTHYTISREAPATPLLRATRPNPLRRSYDVTIGERRVTLRAESPWRGDYLLFEGAVTTGSIRHTAARSRDASATLPDDLPQDAAIALFCLILTIWRQGHARVDTL
jgi:hypothetical protein